MASLIFDKCCFCIDLRVGCFIIAYLQLIAAAIATLLLIIAMAAGGIVIAAASEAIAHHDPEMSGLETAGVQAAGGVMLVVTGILLFFVALALAFVITFVVGLHQEKRGHIKAYFVYATVFQVIGFIIFVVICSTNSVGAVYVISNLIVILLHVYFLMVVRSYYVSMNYSKGPAIYNAA